MVIPRLLKENWSDIQLVDHHGHGHGHGAEISTSEQTELKELNALRDRIVSVSLFLDRAKL